MPPDSATITAPELSTLMNRDNPPVIVDVRRPDEVATAGLDGAINIPLDQLPARVGELPHNRAIVTMCHHGVRSAQAAQFLIAHGLTNVRSLHGGIDAWSVLVDRTVKRY